MFSLKVWKLALCLTACLLGTELSAREVSTPPVFANVVSGIRTRVGLSYGMNPDCSPSGKVIVRLTTKPKKGTVELVSEKGFTSYPKDNQRYKCNEKQTDVESVYYTSQEGYIGKDRFVLDVFYPNANYRKRVFNVDVR